MTKDKEFELTNNSKKFIASKQKDSRTCINIKRSVRKIFR